MTLNVLRWVVLASALCCASGCATVTVQGGEKPIHIVMDINLRVARQLDSFFAFEDSPPAGTQPSAPAKA